MNPMKKKMTAPKPNKKPAKTKAKNKGGAPKGNKNAVGNPGGGRPTDYQGEKSCAAARVMAKLGATDKQIAEGLGIDLSTFHRWRFTHVEFSQAIQMGKDVIDNAVERSLVQRALGYDYETEKALSVGGVGVVKTIVKEHALPDVGAQKFLLTHRKEEYRDKKEVTHVHELGAWLRKSLEDMSARAKLERSERAKLIEHEPAPVG
jgi:hypothetical protein